MEANITNKSHDSTPRKGQSTAYLGYPNSSQDVNVTFSLIGSSSTHNLCSEKANPRIEIPTKSRANSEKLLAGRKKLLGGQ